MSQAREELVSEQVERHHGVDIPIAASIIYTDDPRTAYVEKARELIDRVESGALDGCRHEWCDDPNTPAMVYVENFPIVDGRRISRLVRVTFQPTNRLRIVSEGMA